MGKPIDPHPWPFYPLGGGSGQLVEGEYQGSLLRGNDPIVSQVFPNLQLTAAQIFQS
ncbi:MAG: hypothetical protein VKK80_06675 [Prochlorothrix sp.]|nr:hypothetical protein [Prochlorothrix sp.]